MIIVNYVYLLALYILDNIINLLINIFTKLLLQPI